jgi:para-aminobenzoate synthetase
MKILLVDNYDSFTYNLAQLIAGCCGQFPHVVKNDELNESALDSLSYDAVVLSPGPGHPERRRDFGICNSLILRSDAPVLGVCLGHQGIAHAFGGRVTHAPKAMHGRSSSIYHEGTGLFYGIPSPFSAVRYHSLLVSDLPDCLQADALTEDGLIMAMSHRTRPLWGVQFHPESISTEYGEQLITNFLRLANFRRALDPTSPHKEPLVHSEQLGCHFEMCVRELHDLAPEGSFQRLYSDSNDSFWLDSSSANFDQGLFSYMGDASGPHAKVVKYNSISQELRVQRSDRTEIHTGSLFDYLEADKTAISIVNHTQYPCPFKGGYVGYFGYELKSECGGAFAHQSKYDDGTFLFSDRFVAFDLANSRTWLVCLHAHGSQTEAEAWFDQVELKLANSSHNSSTIDSCTKAEATWTTVPFKARHSRTTYISLVEDALRKITDGESYEICLTNHWTSIFSGDPLALYLRLRAANPAPYSAFISFGKLRILSCSPERFLQIGPDGSVESKPIKGTIRRGASPEEDAALAEQLQTSEKDRAENLMIVDLIRNDLNRVCRTGSVHVSKLYGIESFKTVHQMVSTVVGELTPGVSRIAAIKSLFPGGSMTGAPKIRTMEIIDQLEAGPRGIYSGALGYISLDGAVDLSIVIRTLVIDEDEISLGTGGAIVSLSDADAEYEETLTKADILMRTALGEPPLNIIFKD